MGKWILFDICDVLLNFGSGLECCFGLGFSDQLSRTDGGTVAWSCLGQMWFLGIEIEPMPYC